MFVTKGRTSVALDEDPSNVVFIKSGMDVGTESRVMSAIAAIRGSTGSNMQQVIDIGAFNLALLRNFIVGWEGPLFDGVPCTPDNIEALESNNPLVERVLEEITAVWSRSKAKSADPNLSKPAGAKASKGGLKAV